MPSNVKWNGDQALAMVRAKTARLLAAASIILVNTARKLLSVAGTGPPTRDAKGRFKSTYGANPSAPGEPPHKQTGRLRASVAYEVDETKLTARVGTNVKYGRWLELGTPIMKARPWLRRALAEATPAIKALFAGVKT